MTSEGRGLGGPPVPGGAGRADPLVVVVDDLHWAVQPALLDLIEQVVWPTGRPASWWSPSPGPSCWSSGRLVGRAPERQHPLLEPLAAEESATLLEHLAGEAALPADASDRITRTAEGNPLFLEELLAMLIEEGRLRRDGAAGWPTTWPRPAPRPPSRRCWPPAWTAWTARSGLCWTAPR